MLKHQRHRSSISSSHYSSDHHSLGYKEMGNSYDMPYMNEICPFCQKPIPADCLKAHISKMHGSSMPFVCTLCGRGYQSQAGLSNHMDVHQGKTVLCPVCDNKFSRKFTLKRHLKFVHMSGQCPTCSLVLKLGPDFNDHVLYCGAQK